MDKNTINALKIASSSLKAKLSNSFGSDVSRIVNRCWTNTGRIYLKTLVEFKKELDNVDKQSFSKKYTNLAKNFRTAKYKVFDGRVGEFYCQYRNGTARLIKADKTSLLFEIEILESL